MLLHLHLHLASLNGIQLTQASAGSSPSPWLCPLRHSMQSRPRVLVAQGSYVSDLEMSVTPISGCRCVGLLPVEVERVQQRQATEVP